MPSFKSCYQPVIKEGTAKRLFYLTVVNDVHYVFLYYDVIEDVSIK